MNPSPVLPDSRRSRNPAAGGTPELLFCWVPADSHGNPRRCHVWHRDGDVDELRRWLDLSGLHRVRIRTEFGRVPVFPYAVLYGGAMRYARAGTDAAVIARCADAWRRREGVC